MAKVSEKRIYNNKNEKYCSEDCPFYKYDRNKGDICNYYFEELIGNRYNNDEEILINRCKECLNNTSPIPQKEIIRLLKEINRKLDRLK